MSRPEQLSVVLVIYRWHGS